MIQDQNWLVFTFICLFSNPYFAYSGCSVVASRGQSNSIVLFCFLTVSCAYNRYVFIVFCSVHFVDYLLDSY